MPTANQWTLALRRARIDALRHLYSQGVKIERITMAERSKLAKQWLADHPELFEEAERWLATRP
jgi:hypothetical protein